MLSIEPLFYFLKGVAKSIMFLVNGRQTQSVALTDRSFQYGDGCFTTVLVLEGLPLFWQSHCERMNACLDVLQIEHPDWQQVLTWVEQVVNGFGSSERCGIKLHVSRGSGGRGYGIAGTQGSCITLSAFSYPEHYKDWQRDGVKLGISSVALGHSPILAGHKHNNRLEQVLVKAEVEQHGWQDAVVLDISGNVIETSMANLFWRNSNDEWLTPALDKSGVAGVMRRHVMAQLGTLNQRCKVESVPMTALATAKEVFITNSLLQVVPVISIDGQNYPIGTMTRTIQEKMIS